MDRILPIEIVLLTHAQQTSDESRAVLLDQQASIAHTIRRRAHAFLRAKRSRPRTETRTDACTREDHASRADTAYDATITNDQTCT